MLVSVGHPGPGSGGDLLRVLRADRSAAYPAGCVCRPSAGICTWGELRTRKGVQGAADGRMMGLGGGGGA